MKKLIYFLVCICWGTGIYAQTKKDLKDAGVTSRTETTTRTEKGVTETFKESVEKYDENGNKTEVIEYKSNGDVKSHVTYTYNEKGKLVKETEMDVISGKPSKTTEFTYTENDKVLKEVVYNKKNELEKTITYEYDGALKTKKIITNAKGKVIETKTYTYEKK